MSRPDQSVIVISLDELKEEIDHLQLKIDELKGRRDKCVLLFELLHDHNASAAIDRQSLRHTNGPDAIREILSDGVPRTVNQLLRELFRKGFRTSAKHPEETIRSTLHRGRKQGWALQIGNQWTLNAVIAHAVLPEDRPPNEYAIDISTVDVPDVTDEPLVEPPDDLSDLPIVRK